MQWILSLKPVSESYEEFLLKHRLLSMRFEFNKSRVGPDSLHF